MPSRLADAQGVGCFGAAKRAAPGLMGETGKVPCALEHENDRRAGAMLQVPRPAARLDEVPHEQTGREMRHRQQPAGRGEYAAL